MDHHQETARQHPLDSMKRLLLLLAFLCASIPVLGQSNPPLRITEVDGSPTKTNATRLNFPNGTLTISGSTVTVSASGSFSAPVVITSNSAACFEVGPNGSTNPVFRVVCNVASQAAGVSITGNAAGSGAVINTLSSGSNENLFVLSKGTGSVAVSNATFTPTASVALHVEKAAFGGREIPAKFTVSDGGNSAFFINNGTNNNSLFVPTMAGYLDANATSSSFTMYGMMSAANDASDSATNGAVVVQAFRTDNATDPLNGTLSAVVNRKLFSVANLATPAIVVTAGMALNLGSTGTLGWASTATAAGTIDTTIARSAAATLRVANATTGAGNFIVGTSAGAIGTSGAGVLGFTLSTAPSTSPTDTVQVYSNDAAAGAHELWTRNELGEVTPLTGLTARNSADFTATSDTTTDNITGLSRNVVNGRAYKFIVELYTTSNVAGGVKSAVNCTCTVSAIVYEALTIDAAVLGAQTRATALDTDVGGITAVTAAHITITGTFVASSSGVFSAQFSQNASNVAASTVLANSTLQLVPIG